MALHRNEKSLCAKARKIVKLLLEQNSNPTLPPPLEELPINVERQTVARPDTLDFGERVGLALLIGFVIFLALPFVSKAILISIRKCHIDVGCIDMF